MSNYISADRFLSLDKKVQDKIIEWWKPKLGDWATFKGIDFHYNSNLQKSNDYCFVESYSKEREESQWDDDYGITLYDIFNIGNNYSKYGNSFKSKFEVIPLLTETQLRTYIEDTIKGGVNIKCDEEGYILGVWKNDIEYLSSSSTDLLECYLDIAVKVS